MFKLTYLQSGILLAVVVFAVRCSLLPSERPNSSLVKPVTFTPEPFPERVINPPPAYEILPDGRWKEINPKLIPSSSPKPKSTAKNMTAPKNKAIRLLTAECGGVPYPTQTGYIKKCPALAIGGYSSVTVDNSQNNSDVFVKLFTLGTTPPKAASVFFIRANDKFTVTDVQPGKYDIRYRDLTSRGLLRTEQFELKEIRTSQGVRFGRITMTLYKVTGGNMQTQPISEAEF